MITAARIAITALAPTIRRVPEAEAALIGSDGGRRAAEAAADAASAASRPISDARGTDAYRRAMAGVITRRAITAARGPRPRPAHPHPRQPGAARRRPSDGASMKHSATITANGVPYEV